MATSQVGLAAQNAAASNENDVSAVAATPLRDSDTASAAIDAPPLTLFTAKSEDEYHQAIRSLCAGGGVAGYVNMIWDRNRTYRMSMGIDAEMIAALNRRAGKYSPQAEAAISAISGSKVYPRLIDTLCRNIKALVDECFMSVERPEKLVVKGAIELTKEQRKALVVKAQREWMKLSYERQQPLDDDETVELIVAMEAEAKADLAKQAQVAARGMEDLIYGQFSDGGFEQAFGAALEDALTLKLGVIYGPYAAVTTKTTFQYNKRGVLEPYSEPRFIYRWRAISPFDVFPSAGSRTLDEGDLVIRDRLTPSQMLGMKGQTGWRDEAIDRVVHEHGEQGFYYFTSFDNSRAFAEKRGTTTQRNYGFIEFLRLHGYISGDRLMATGMAGDEREINANMLYHVDTIVCGTEVLYMAVLDDRIDFRPYSCVSYVPTTGGLWGEGVGEVAATEDSIQSAASRAKVDNAGFCSRPTGTYDKSQIVPGQALGAWYPGRMLSVMPRQGATTKPIEFYKLDSRLKDLMEMERDAERAACIRVGIPFPDMGTERAAGAGRTATGFSDIVNGMTKPVKGFVYRCEAQIWRPNMDRMVILNNLYHDDEAIKTAANIEPQGLFAELEHQARADRSLAIYDRVSKDPLVTPKKRAALLRSIGDDNGIVESALPSDEDAEAMEAAQRDATAQATAMAAQPAAPGGEAAAGPGGTLEATQPEPAMAAVG